MNNEIKAPLPPYDLTSAVIKARMAEDAWNGQNPAKIAMAYSKNSKWRNRDQFVEGRDEIIQLLTAKWQKEHKYRLIKEVWAVDEHRIAVRFAYEYCNDQGQWYRAYGNENWQFDENGLMEQRHASINDLKIDESERKFHWPIGRRPDEHPGLTQLGL
ncbi:MAG: hypothetical protein COB74_04020 [Shewanella sp.]|nr:nuclear transport factor 2 family protein [Shewanella sp.]PHQ75816.1 MAG: hypothetical protein COB74_04020 [Shewanella sp.]